MNQKLSDWASIAEIISGVAVVITLIFLILGIQENTAVTRAVAYDRNIDSVNSIRSQILQDPELSRLLSAFERLHVDDLNEADQVRLRLLVAMVLGVYEKAYFANQYGILGPSEWERFSSRLCTHHTRLESAKGIRADVEAILSSEFVSYMNSLCDQLPQTAIE